MASEQISSPVSRRGVEKLLANLGVSELIVESLTLAEAAHVDLDAVGADVFGPLECAEFLPLEDHPIADADLVALVGDVGSRGETGERAGEQAACLQLQWYAAGSCGD